MRPHEPEQVKRLRDDTEAKRADESEHTYALGDLEVFYSVVPSDEELFPYAVVSAVLPQHNRTKIPRTDYEIAVSDDVPEELRGLWAWQELYAFAKLGHTKLDRCLEGEKHLVNLVGSETVVYALYLLYRIPFYEGLIRYIGDEINRMGDDTPYSIQDLMGANSALSFLHDIEKLQEKSITQAVLQ